MPRPDPVAAAAAAAPKPWASKGWEAWLGGEWYGVEVLSVEKEVSKIRWDWDKSDAEIWNHYLRPTEAAKAAKEASAAPSAPAAPAQSAQPAQSVQPRLQEPQQGSPPAQRQPLLPAAVGSRPMAVVPKPAPKAAPPQAAAGPGVGAAVEGLYGGGDAWYDGVVVQAEARGVLMVKWEYDGSETMLPVESVRPKDAPPAAAREEVAATVAARPAKAPPSMGLMQEAAPKAAPKAALAAAKAAPSAAPAAARGGPMEARDVMRILELVPQDAPAEVRVYLESLIPGGAKPPPAHAAAAAVAATSSTWL